jgi:transposase
VEEAARAAAPVEEALVAEVLESELLHADETPHKEHGQPLWLWVFASSVTVLFYVGARTKEMIDNLLAETFGGWLMSDGYAAYRSYAKRLRCWAHLLRKAKGLEQSLDPAGRRFGADTTALLKTLMEAVYRAREGPGADLRSQYKKALDAFRAACEQAKASRHEKTRALAVEFLNDWDSIFRVLAHPHLPLTNNEAERAWRHWVILRRITYGTRTPQGSRAFALAFEHHRYLPQTPSLPGALSCPGDRPRSARIPAPVASRRRFTPHAGGLNGYDKRRRHRDSFGSCSGTR